MQRDASPEERGSWALCPASARFLAESWFWGFCHLSAPTILIQNAGYKIVDYDGNGKIEDMDLMNWFNPNLWQVFRRSNPHNYECMEKWA
jgi:hypothetical protein